LRVKAYRLAPLRRHSFQLPHHSTGTRYTHSACPYGRRHDCKSEGRLGLVITGMPTSLTAALGSTLAVMPTKSETSIGVMGRGVLGRHKVELGTISTVMPTNYGANPGATINGMLTTHDWNLDVKSIGVRADHSKIGGVNVGVKADYSCESFGSQTLAGTLDRIEKWLWHLWPDSFRSFGGFAEGRSVVGTIGRSLGRVVSLSNRPSM